MKTELKSTLEQALDKWVIKQCEHRDRPGGLIYPHLHIKMAEAAAAVYDASFSAQEFASKE